MQGDKRPIYPQRLNRDIAELLSYDFSCSSSSLAVVQSDAKTTIFLEIDILEGPYRGGHFKFCLNIPDNYPFKCVDVWSKHPIWHPNIDLSSGKVVLPLEWSPVITLQSIALGVQMLMLEPSVENPLNLDAFSFYMNDVSAFESRVQRTLGGDCMVNGISFPNVTIPTNGYRNSYLNSSGYQSLTKKRMHDSIDSSTAPVPSSSGAGKASPYSVSSSQGSVIDVIHTQPPSPLVLGPQIVQQHQQRVVNHKKRSLDYGTEEDVMGGYSGSNTSVSGGNSTQNSSNSRVSHLRVSVPPPLPPHSEDLSVHMTVEAYSHLSLKAAEQQRQAMHGSSSSSNPPTPASGDLRGVPTGAMFDLPPNQRLLTPKKAKLNL